MRMLERDFDRWRVLRRHTSTTSGRHVQWICQCACGTIRTVTGGSLRSGNSRSCGCLQKDLLSIRARTHGRSGTHIQRVYKAMKGRCLNPNNPGWKDYGGRGIKIHEDWLGPHGLENFYAHIGDCPSPQHSLDRYPNNDGDYEPGNVRWATKKQQQRNRRSTRVLYSPGAGLTLPLPEWADLVGIHLETLRARLDKQGWGADRALETPTGPQQRT